MIKIRIKNLMTQVMMTQIGTGCMLEHRSHGRLVVSITSRKMVNKRKTPSSKQSEYERQRQMNIEKNAMRFQALGKERDNHIHDEEDQEYIPEKNGDDDLLNMREEHAAENGVLSSTTNCISNEVGMVTTRRRAAFKRNQPSCPAMSIVEFLDQRKQ
ncbi:hypothetical protein Cgig2_003389 [Carnegiea gigantea]|uniref:Uncharacterized protein n=1 Tax=Carnegiea gigantea TaxID=171969 RepID=A0A9Q1JPY9_9CARY|nr:hypothetical protein Cgig2_003389 [Carnegiea gigantea]